MNQVFLRESRTCSFYFNENEILKIIRDLNIHKAHGHNDIYIRMIKICDKSLLKLLILLFHNLIKSSCSLTYGKDLISYLLIKRVTNSYL